MRVPCPICQILISEEELFDHLMKCCDVYPNGDLDSEEELEQEQASNQLVLEKNRSKHLEKSKG